ncbi:MAG TPA: hypothetical protein VE641_05535 [Chthoniobacterales bacterium]|nr:hypothetical protein [Chthoniobacterales bacterium]
MGSSDCAGSPEGAIPPKSNLLAFVGKQFLEVVPPTLFFAVGFNVIVLTTQLILADYLIHFANFMLVTFSALVVGKAVLVANHLPFFRRFDTAPIIQPILFKTLIYCIVVLIVRFIEKLAKYLLTGGTFDGIPDYVEHHFSWNRFIAIQIWVFILFLIYTIAAELNSLFGSGELAKILFTRRSSELKLRRRQRVRALVKLSRLTEAHSLDELRDRNTPAHQEMIDLITKLSARKGDR